ncbi:MAG: DUF2079 domain-containing protein [Ardenticatenaceae bacterium]
MRIRKSSFAWWVVLGLVALYALFFSAYTVQRHDAFLTTAFDLGNFDQAIWNTAHGRPLALTNIPGVTIRLAHHVEPILFLIAPLYWLWSDVRAILILQSVAIAAGGIPLYWYAARRVGAWAGVIFVAIYLLFPALQGVNLFDFHAVALAPFFLLLAWNWLDEERDGPFLVAAVLAAMTKEEISLLVAMMGLYALLVQRRRFGWLPFVAGFGWFLFIIEVISPAFNQSGQHEFIGFYGQWGDSALDVAFYLLTHPLEVIQWLSGAERVAYLRDLFTPTLAISLLAPQVLLIAAPSFAVNLLSSYPPMTTLEGFHYPAPIVPFVLLSAVAGLRQLADWTQTIRARSNDFSRSGPERLKSLLPALIIWVGAWGMLFATLIYHHAHGATPLAADWEWPTIRSHHRVGEAIMATIPPDAAVSAQSQINPHLSQREQIYRFPDVREADFILIDVTVASLFFHPNDLRRDMEERLVSGQWGIQRARDGWLLLGRCGAEGIRCDQPSTGERRLPDEFYSYATVANQSEFRPQYGINAQVSDLLRLHGYDVASHPDGTQIRLYWEALRPINEPLRLWPVFYDATWNTVLEDTSQRVLMETVWYPPQAWKAGQLVQTTKLPWPIEATDWNLAVAVLAGDEPSSPRLPITIHSSDVVPEFGKEQLLTLLKVREGEVLADSLRRFALPDDMRAIGALLDDGIRLAGVQYSSPSASQEGNRLSVTLGWQASDSVPRADYTVFLQLLGPNGLVAQSDAYPTSLPALKEGEGSQADQIPLLRPTTGWASGEVILDHHTLSLPPDLPAGEYQLIAGMYNLAQNGARLPATLEGVPLPDAAIPLGTVKMGGTEGN